MSPSTLALLAALAAAPQAPKQVGILVMDGIFNTELVGPYDVLDHAKDFEVFTVAPRKQPLRSAEGLAFTPDHGFGEHPPIDVLVIPSFEKYEDHLKDKALIDWIRRQATSASWVLTHCWGALYLAQTGLLDGRSATTYPPDNEAFAKRFAKVKVERGYRFVRDGKFITSAGGTASFESPLYLVRTTSGDDAARKVARGLVIDDPLQSKLRYLVKGDR